MLLRSCLAAALVGLMTSVSFADEPTPPLEVRSYTIRHRDVQEVNAMVRSILNLRRTAVDEQANVMIVSDEADRIRAFEDLLAKIDVALPRWSAEIVAECDGCKSPVAVMPLDGGGASWSAGDAPEKLGDRASLRVMPQSAGEHETQVGVEFMVLAGGNAGAQSLQRRETYEIVLRDGESHVLVAIGGPPDQLAVKNLLGLPAPVRSLKLVMHRLPASSRDGGPGR